MKILVLNCGSSSIKYQLVDMANNAQVMAKGLLERIGLEMGEFTHKWNGQKHYEQKPIPNHTEGIKIVLAALVDPQIGVIKDLKEIGAVGNRVAHGGEIFKESCLVTDKVIEQIKSLEHLAPLHTPGNLAGIYAMREVLPGVPQAVVFDTAFHSTLPPKSYLYGLPYDFYKKYGIRRYGFHGTSHKFVGPRAAEIAGVDYNHSKIISCHLGSGASICAIKDGKSVDTSMGFTPVEGLIMGTRCGDLDLGVMLHIAEKENMNFKQITTFINKECGLKGVSGKGVDMRDIRAGKEAGDLRSTYAFDMFSYRVKKYIGAYAAAMGGVDVILFTGGIGENAFFQREPICEGLEFLGAKLDKEKNKTVIGDDAIISTPDSKVKLVVVATNEELVIATDTYNIATGKN